MRLPASVWCSVGVLTVAIVGGNAHSKRQIPDSHGISFRSLPATPAAQAVVEDVEPRLIRLESGSGASVPDVESVVLLNPAEKTPALAGAIETRLRIRESPQISDYRAFDLSVSDNQDRANWVAAVEKWACGNSTGLTLYFPKWSVDRQLMSPITESGGLGIGLQYKATF